MLAELGFSHLRIILRRPFLFFFIGHSLHYDLLEGALTAHSRFVLFVLDLLVGVFPRAFVTYLSILLSLL